MHRIVAHREAGSNEEPLAGPSEDLLIEPRPGLLYTTLTYSRPSKPRTHITYMLLPYLTLHVKYAKMSSL